MYIMIDEIEFSTHLIHVIKFNAVTVNPSSEILKTPARSGALFCACTLYLLYISD